MPEYSSTTITPADGVQVPSMNGSTSGNFALSALRDYILASKGQANGLASLGSDGKLTPSQLPDLADDVIVVASYAVLPATGTAGKIYITADNNKMYRWDSDLSTPDYVELSVDLSEYAKLTDLAAEETARETADTNLNNALTALDHRVQNLEQAHGSYVVQNYKDGSITPSGKGKWCVVEGIEGVSRVENQIADISDGSSGTGNTIGTHFTTFQYSHFYLFALRATFPSQPTSGGGSASPSTPIYLGLWNNALTSFQRHPFPYQSNGNYAFVGSGASLDGNLTDGSSAKVVLQTFPNSGELCTFADVILTDLNIYFNTSDLSFLGATDSAMLATIQKDYPHLLLPSEYGTRIVDSSYSGVRAEGNLIDESSYGLISEISRYGLVADVDEGFFTLSGTAGQSYATGLYVNGNLTDIENVSGSFSRTFNVSEPCKLMIWINSSTNYLSNVMLNRGMVADPHCAYMPTHTLSFPSTSLKSAGSVRDTLELNVEVSGVARRRDTQRIGQVDLGTLASATYDSSDSRFRIILPSSLGIAVPSGVRTETVIIPLYVCLANSEAFNVTWDLVCYIGSVGSEIFLYIHDHRYNASDIVNGKATWLNGVTMNYPLATESVTLSDPILDNTLLTESGGRLSTVQTGTVVDGIADLGFITL